MLSDLIQVSWRPPQKLGTAPAVIGAPICVPGPTCVPGGRAFVSGCLFRTWEEPPPIFSLAQFTQYGSLSRGTCPLVSKLLQEVQLKHSLCHLRSNALTNVPNKGLEHRVHVLSGLGTQVGWYLNTIWGKKRKVLSQEDVPKIQGRQRTICQDAQLEQTLDQD